MTLSRSDHRNAGSRREGDSTGTPLTCGNVVRGVPFGAPGGRGVDSLAGSRAFVHARPAAGVGTRDHVTSEPTRSTTAPPCTTLPGGIAWRVTRPATDCGGHAQEGRGHRDRGHRGRG